MRRSRRSTGTAPVPVWPFLPLHGEPQPGDSTALGTDHPVELVTLLSGALTHEHDLGRPSEPLGEIGEDVRGSPRLTLAVFLVADQDGVDRRVRRSGRGPLLHPDHGAGHHRLHVRGAAAPEIVTVDSGNELAIIGFGRNDVVVPAHGDGREQLAGKTGNQRRIPARFRRARPRVPRSATSRRRTARRSAPRRVARPGQLVTEGILTSSTASSTTSRVRSVPDLDDDGRVGCRRAGSA